MTICKTAQINHDEIVRLAVETLEKGGIVVYPTETCYGIGVDATNQAAVDKLLEYKVRREGKPLSIAVPDKTMAREFVELNEIAENLYDNYLPGPIAVVSRGLGKVAHGVESEFGTLGVRIPAYALIREIVTAFGRPITATSANISYKDRPYSIPQLLRDTPERQQNLIDLIIDADELPKNEPSTVVDTTLNNLNIMRKGTLLVEKLVSQSKAVLEATTKSDIETVEFGGLNMLKYIDVPLEQPLLFCLSGELGAGKTQFSKGVAMQLGITKIVKSPTFTILNEYDYVLGQRKGKFVHVDTWRIESMKDLDSVGIHAYFKTGNVLAIEWADKFFEDIVQLGKDNGAKIINVIFRYIDESTRQIESFES
jgi:L-threonylcarbamoyladenylate synthase